MPDQLSLFKQGSVSKAPLKRLSCRRSCELEYRNGARVEGTQDRYGFFWVVKVTHHGRIAFTTVRDMPEKGQPAVERLIKSLEH